MNKGTSSKADSANYSAPPANTPALKVPTTQKNISSARIKIISLGILTIITPLFTIIFGPASVPLNDVIGVLANHFQLSSEVNWDEITDAIVWETRMPRIIIGLCIGAILGVCGVALQAIVRNPLAEPYVLGVSSGAAVGAASAIIVLGVTSKFAVAGLAFLGAILAIFFVLIAGGRKDGSALKLILAGLAIGYTFQSITNLIIFSSSSPETSRAVMFWMLGSMSKSQWLDIPIIASFSFAIVIILTICAPFLDALASGDQTSLSIGINPRITRTLLLIPISAAVAAAVSVCGGIGFVGLVIPHMIRRWIGHSHRNLVLGSGFAGAILLVWADAISRIVFSPAEMPIGVVTGLIGAPFLLLLISKMKSS